MFIEFAGLFTYTAENGELEIQGNFESLGIPNGSIIEYKFSDDKLVLINGEDDNMIFTKIEF